VERGNSEGRGRGGGWYKKIQPVKRFLEERGGILKYKISGGKKRGKKGFEPTGGKTQTLTHLIETLEAGGVKNSFSA